jgi:hypothetical protein
MRWARLVVKVLDLAADDATGSFFICSSVAQTRGVSSWVARGAATCDEVADAVALL